MQHACHLAVERDAAGDAKIAASGLAQRQTREVECGLLEALLDRERDVTMTLRDLLAGSARRSKPGGDLVAEEPAVAAFAVEDGIGIDPNAVRRDLQELFDEGAHRRDPGGRTARGPSA